MSNTEQTVPAMEDVLKKSYDLYTTVAQTYNELWREQLQLLEDAIEINDKQLRTPYPGIGSTEITGGDFNNFVGQIRDLAAKRTESVLELWSRSIGYWNSATSEVVETT